ncbi:hypothetical protein Aph02nite_20790 [Actinoplanes philippinensis]|uniref:L,D-transpeptidase family protein n=1 Tax=Actinoplanes philippinensis TaxID=35752 RepID=UPI0015A6041C|nr:hypothetical protein [Actinoplanes philippinensis]GIE76129.1 hypothetical protein Aph02nite_20790 [Actinoplanes philippinensis]
MSSQKASWLSRSVFVIGLVVAGLMVPASAQAYTQKKLGTYKSAPYMVFEVNRSNPLRSKLTAYVSLKNGSYRLSMRAGSGNGTKSECVSNKGHIPSGVYDPDDEDRKSTLQYIPNKRNGSEVVRGAVWSLGNKTCTPKSGERRITRTLLYIHSQGATAWSGNYASNGCIKISQKDRAQLKKMWSGALYQQKRMLMVF